MTHLITGIMTMRVKDLYICNKGDKNKRNFALCLHAMTIKFVLNEGLVSTKANNNSKMSEIKFTKLC